MKRVITLTFVLLLVAVPVFAESGDIYRSDGTFFMSAKEFLTDRKAIEAYINVPDVFLTEIDGLLYKSDDIAKAFKENPGGNYIETLKKSVEGIIPKDGDELKVVDFKLSARGTFAEVSLSKKAKLEELAKIKVKPEGVFEKVEGKTATLKFKEKLQEGEEVKIDEVSKRFKPIVQKKLELSGGVDDFIKYGLEFIGAELEYDSFLGKWFAYFEKSFRIKNNYTDTLRFVIEDPKWEAILKPGDKSEPVEISGTLLKIAGSSDKADNPKFEATFEKARPGEDYSDDNTVLTSNGNPDGKDCTIKEGTKVEVKVKLGSTVVSFFTKTYGKADNATGLINDLKGLKADGKQLFKDFKQIKGSSNPENPAKITFKIAGEGLILRPVLIVIVPNQNPTADTDIKSTENGGIFVPDDGSAVEAKPAEIKIIKWEAQKNKNYRLIIRENGKQIFEGFFKTGNVDGDDKKISEQEWKGLNNKKPAITFKGEYDISTNGSEKYPSIVFGSEFGGILTLEIEGWY